MSEKNPFGFRIRRIVKHGEEPAPAPAAEPPPVPGREPAPPPRAEAKTLPPQGSGGCFRSASALLSCIGAVAAARLTEEVTCRRGPQGQWWLEVPLGCEKVAPLVWAAGACRSRPRRGPGARCP